MINTKTHLDRTGGLTETLLQQVEENAAASLTRYKESGALEDDESCRAIFAAFLDLTGEQGLIGGLFRHDPCVSTRDIDQLDISEESGSWHFIEDRIEGDCYHVLAVDLTGAPREGKGFNPIVYARLERSSGNSYILEIRKYKNLRSYRRGTEPLNTLTLEVDQDIQIPIDTVLELEAQLMGNLVHISVPRELILFRALALHILDLKVKARAAGTNNQLNPLTDLAEELMPTAVSY